MIISITDRGDRLPSETWQWIHRRLMFVFSKFEYEVQEVRVEFKDPAENRSCVQPSCVMFLQTRVAGRLVMEDTNPDAKSSLSYLCRRAEREILRKLAQ